PGGVTRTTAAVSLHGALPIFNDILSGTACQKIVALIPRARALVDDLDALINTHTVLVKQPVEQPFRPDGRIKQFIVLHRVQQSTSLLPGIINRMTIAPIFGIIVTPGNIRHSAPFFGAWQKLDQHATCTPAFYGAAVAENLHPRDAEAHLGGDLLGLLEIG